MGQGAFLDGHGEIGLDQIIPRDFLQSLLLEYEQITGLPAGIHDFRGNIIIDGDREKAAICRRIRSSQLGCYCEKCDSLAGLAAARSGKPHAYRCYLGSIQTATPIIVNNQYMGILIMGKAKLPPEEMERIQFIIPPLTDFSQLPDDLRQECETLSDRLVYTSYDTLMNGSRLLGLIGNYIAETGYQALMKEKAAGYQRRITLEQQQIRELELNLSQAQIQALQSQVNPQFLFNIFDAIKATAKFEGTEETPELIGVLSDLLRRTFVDGNDTPTLEQEVKYIKNYLTIVKTSLGERLTITFDIQQSSLDARIPALTLQPFIENAIVHGIEAKPEGGELFFAIQRHGGYLLIRIEDTGVGIPPGRLAEIYTLKELDRSPLPRTDVDKHHSIGITNAIYILESFFNRQFDWDIQSKQGFGTEVLLKIPYIPWLDALS